MVFTKEALNGIREPGRRLENLMMRQSNKGIVIVFLIIIGVPITWGLYLYFTADVRMYQNEWGITLPGNFKKQYYTSQFGGTGDRETYGIYALKGAYTQEDESVLEGMSSQKNTEIQDQIVTILKVLKVDTQKYPNFSHKYKWKTLEKSQDSRHAAKLYILFDMELSSLYFVQVRR